MPLKDLILLDLFCFCIVFTYFVKSRYVVPTTYFQMQNKRPDRQNKCYICLSAFLPVPTPFFPKWMIAGDWPIISVNHYIGRDLLTKISENHHNTAGDCPEVSLRNIQLQCWNADSNCSQWLANLHPLHLTMWQPIKQARDTMWTWYYTFCEKPVTQKHKLLTFYPGYWAETKLSMKLFL